MSDPDNPDRTKWLNYEVTPDLVQFHNIKHILFSSRTEFDEKEESIYRESLVHPAMHVHPNPETVFIDGYSKSSTLRGELAYKTIKKKIIIDIDKQALDVCRQYHVDINWNSLNDKRARLHFTDTHRYLNDNKDKYDVIIIDLPEPLEGGPASLLYTGEFFQNPDRLRPAGIMSV